MLKEWMEEESDEKVEWKRPCDSAKEFKGETLAAKITLLLS
jgi:hypothetical protein